MGTPAIDPAALKAFTSAFKGTILAPGDAPYDEARTIFNAMIDRKPALIAQCTSPADVAATIALARETGLALSVRSGGHSVAGASIAEGGIVCDMRAMNKVSVNPETRVATVGGGAAWGDFDKATQEHALGATGGRVSTTGVAGLTLGGGSGWIERKFGLACDNLRSVELVTADGSTVRASEKENADLFWAMHGAGANFGVVTQFEFDLKPLGPEILVGLVLYSPERGEEVGRHYRDFLATAPDELGGGFAYLTGPPEEFVPEKFRGQIVAGVIVTWCGDIEEGQRVCKPLFEFGPPDGAMVAPVPYTMFQSMLDDPPGFRNYWTADYHEEFPDAAIQTMGEYGRKMKPSPTQLILLPWGGAVARSNGDTPMDQRHANWVSHPLALWEGKGDDEFWMGWARGYSGEMKKYATGGVYLNFVGDEGQDRIVAAFGKANYDRLVEIKTQYDPQNLFRFNQNIKPQGH